MPAMNEPRIEQAVRRIEAALGRIAGLAERMNPAPPPVAELAAKHEALREIVSNTLKELDEILERLDK